MITSYSFVGHISGVERFESEPPDARPCQVPHHNSSQHSRMTLSITVKTLQQKQFKVEAEPSDTVAQLKQKIEGINGAPVANQKLVYSGKILADDKTVEECNIKEKDFLVLMVSKVCVQPVLCRSFEGLGQSADSKAVLSWGFSRKRLLLQLPQLLLLLQAIRLQQPLRHLSPPTRSLLRLFLHHLHPPFKRPPHPRPPSPRLLLLQAPLLLPPPRTHLPLGI